MLLDSQDVFCSLSLSQSWIMSALLSSLSLTVSHIHYYVRRMSLNYIQGKIISSVVLKNFQSCALTILGNSNVTHNSVFFSILPSSVCLAHSSRQSVRDVTHTITRSRLTSLYGITHRPVCRTETAKHISKNIFK